METIIVYLTNTFLFTKTKAFLAFIVWLFGVMIWWFDIMKQALFILIMLDFFLGFINAWRTNTLSKARIQLGMIKIVWYCLALIILNYTSIAIWWLSINGFWLVEFWVSYLALNEWLSWLRHLSKMWVPIPVALINKIESYKDNLELKNMNLWNTQKQ